MKKPFKLLIAVPCMDYVHVDFMQSLLKLCQHLQREGICYQTEIQSGTLVYFARNRLACKAIKGGIQWLKKTLYIWYGRIQSQEVDTWLEN